MAHVYVDRGPTSSRDYNNRVRETAEQFLSLLGRVVAAEAEVDSVSKMVALEHVSLSGRGESLSAQIEALQNDLYEEQTNQRSLKTCTIFDQANVLSVNIQGDPLTGLNWDSDVGLVTLDYDSRVSKLGFYSGADWVINPATRVAYTMSVLGSEANDPARAIDGRRSTAFIAYAPDAPECDLTYYTTVPTDTAMGALVNYIEIDPTPYAHLSLVRVCYTETPNPILDESVPGQWKDLWVNGDTVTDLKKRFRAPQENGDNVQTEVGPRRYYFGERMITAVKVVLRSTEALEIDEDGAQHFIGIRHLDVGHVTFASTGSRFFEYSLPAGVKRLTSLTPRVVNSTVNSDGPDAMIDGIGSDLPNVSIYTLIEGSWTPYGLNTSLEAIENIKVEVTMNQTTNGCSPLLAGFDIEYLRT